MPALPHLPLRRVEYEAPRRKRPPFGRIPNRNYETHAQRIETQVDQAITQITQTRRVPGINPDLILRVRVSGPVDETAWSRMNFTVLGQTDDHALVMFASDAELREFRTRLHAYQGGPREGRRHAPLAGIFSNIEEMGAIRPEDRIGRILRSEGIAQPNQLLEGTTYTLDVELWHTGDLHECRTRLDQMRAHLEARGGRISDTYVGSSLVLARIRADGPTIREILDLASIATVDRPPRVSLRVSELLNVGLDELGEIPQPPAGATGICTLDSGITSGHLSLTRFRGHQRSVLYGVHNAEQYQEWGPTDPA